jgi:hypothetical protein
LKITGFILYLVFSVELEFDSFILFGGFVMLFVFISGVGLLKVAVCCDAVKLPENKFD